MKKELETEETYQAITHGIRVTVKPRYLDDNSTPETGRHVWAYDIEIANERTTTVQLRERQWTIIDSLENHECVQGPGVAGEQPILNPGDMFRYSSGCLLKTPSGFMRGQYTMADETGCKFMVDIPAFALDLPNVRRVVN